MPQDARARSSISRKLYGLVIAAISSAVLAATGLMAWHETDRYVAEKQQALLAVAQVFSSATGPATAAGDRVSAQHAMRAIGKIPGILHAHVETLTGDTLAQMGFAAQLDSDARLGPANTAASLAHVLRSRSLQVAVPIVDSGERVGSFVLWETPRTSSAIC